jgi:hypothetical protein
MGLLFSEEEFAIAYDAVKPSTPWSEESTRALCNAVEFCGHSFHAVADRIGHGSPRQCEAWYFGFASAILQSRERAISEATSQSPNDECRAIGTATLELLRKDPLFRPTAVNRLSDAQVAKLAEEVSAAKRVDVEATRRRELRTEANARVDALAARVEKEPTVAEVEAAAEDAAWHVAVAVDELRTRSSLQPREVDGEFLLVDHPPNADRRHRQVEVHLEAAVEEAICCPHPAVQQRIDSARMMLAANGVLSRAIRARQQIGAFVRRAEEAVCDLEADAAAV